MGERACVNCFAPLTGGPVCPQCGFDNAAYRPHPHHLPPGVILRDRYVVGRAMGQGGFGITYVGFDTSLDRKVAVKEYFPEGIAIRDAARTARVSCYSSQSYQERYGAGLRKCMNEAKSLARLDDIPGIVRVLDHFQQNNTAYVIMEFVEGVTLVAYLKRLPQRPGYREALSLLAPVGNALRRVHERGFVHRDVSPDNIMVNPEGEPKLLDFGAVKTVSEGGSATETPVIKRGFSPTEMYSTDGRIGPWSDVYAYCATLYYILTGQPAPEPMTRMENDALGGRLSRILSPAQTAALLKGLAIQPHRRYQSMAETVAALNACCNDPAPAAKTASPASPMPETEMIAKRAPETVQIDNPPPETVVTGQPGLKKPGPAAAPETEVIAQPASKNPGPATEKQPPVKPAPENAGYPYRTQKADAPVAVIVDPPKTGGKKKTGVIIAAVAAIAALCIVIVIAAGKSSGNVSTTSSTTQAPSSTQAAGSDNSPITPLNSANVGDYVIFGAYEQNNNTINGKEDIEWKVLAKEDGKALLISRYGLDCQPYNESYNSVTWETCTLRTWLNGKFLNSAFSADEQSQIVSGTVTNDMNPSYGTGPGSDTIDQIFLLSSTEAEEYFSSDAERKCDPTAYAKARGAKEYKKTGCCWWWLRSPDHILNAADVDRVGGINRIGIYVNNPYVVVRPAMWVELSS